MCDRFRNKLLHERIGLQKPFHMYKTIGENTHHIDKFINLCLNQHDRKNKLIEAVAVVIDDGVDQMDSILLYENNIETNEIIFIRHTTQQQASFENFSRRNSTSPDNICDLDYIDIQNQLKLSNKSICYYLIFYYDNSFSVKIIFINQNYKISN